MRARYVLCAKRLVRDPASVPTREAANSQDMMVDNMTVDIPTEFTSTSASWCSTVPNTPGFEVNALSPRLDARSAHDSDNSSRGPAPVQELMYVDSHPAAALPQRALKSVPDYHGGRGRAVSPCWCPLTTTRGVRAPEAPLDSRTVRAASSFDLSPEYCIVAALPEAGMRGDALQPIRPFTDIALEGGT